MDNLYTQATKLYADGKNQQAIKTLLKLLKYKKNDLSSLTLLGGIYYRIGDYASAIDIYQRAIEIAPKNYYLHNFIGAAYAQLGKHYDAVKEFGESIKLNTKYVEAYDNLGQSLVEIKEYDNALECFKKAIQLNPDYWQSYSNIATLLRRNERPKEAIEFHNKSIELAPDDYRVYDNIGITLMELGNYAEAEGYFVESLKLNPDGFMSYNNLAQTFQREGKIQSALTAFKMASQLNPEFVDIKWNIALMELALGRFESGWKGYEYGLARGFRIALDFKKPFWNGEDLHDKTIIISGEQGIGDEILFAACFNDLITIANKVYINCDARLVPVYKRSFPTCEFLPGRLIEDYIKLNNNSVPEADFQIPAASLPRFFRKSISEFPGKYPFLVADEERIEYWRKEWEKIGKKLNVGIAWRSGLATYARSYNYTNLKDWMDILRIENINFVNLQYDEISHNEIQDLKDNFGIDTITIPDGIDLKDDIDDIAALLKSLDLIVGTGTASVSLAGALGVEIQQLITRSDWPVHGTDYYPWYPSVKCLFQSKPPVWNDELDVIKSVLKGRIAQ